MYICTSQSFVTGNAIFQALTMAIFMPGDPQINLLNKEKKCSMKYLTN